MRGVCDGRQESHRDVTTHAVIATGDEVVAEVELIIGVPEDGRVAGQGLPLVEAHTCTRKECDVSAHYDIVI